MTLNGITVAKRGSEKQTLFFSVPFLFVSFSTLLQCCGVGCCVRLSLPLSALWLHLDLDVSHCLRPKSVLRLPLSLRADWPRSPLAHGCRSTHNSPVHSACSSQRLSQNFSVSVPTLIFTGTGAREGNRYRGKRGSLTYKER